MKNKQDRLKDFRKIPGVGKKIAEELWELGLRSVKDLSTKSPEDLYNQLNALKKTKPCRCMLYVFRCAVYFAKEPHPDPILLNWWMWKDSS